MPGRLVERTACTCKAVLTCFLWHGVVTRLYTAKGYTAFPRARCFVLHDVAGSPQNGYCTVTLYELINKYLDANVGLQYLLPATWTALQHHGGGVQRLVAVLCEAPARLVGMSHRKGRLAVGYDADIVVSHVEYLASDSSFSIRHSTPLNVPWDVLLFEG